jgi:hypothetical protein
MSQGQDPFEFIKNFWASVPGMGGSGGMGANTMPSFDPKDLEKRLGELKQVKQWLEMNLNMLNLQINTMEMQLSAISSFKGESYTGGGKNAFQMPPHAPAIPPDMSQANQAASDAAKAAGEAGAQALAQGAQALQAMPWANPGEWLKSIQSAFVPPPAKKGKAGSAAKVAAPAAKKPASKKSAARKAGAKSRTGSRAARPAASEHEGHAPTPGRARKSP